MSVMRSVRVVNTIVSFVAVALFAACQTALDDRPESTQISDLSFNTDLSADVYTLGNGDQLRVTVFGEPDLSGEYFVDGTGLVSLPLVGEIMATGTTVRAFQQELEEQLIAKELLLAPKVSAEVINFRPYYILGEVGRPGEYPYTDALTVMNAVATAEGFTYRANRRKIFIRAADQSDEQAVRLSPTLRVRPGDTIRIAERIF